jgi:hypothetical protein
MFVDVVGPGKPCAASSLFNAPSHTLLPAAPCCCCCVQVPQKDRPGHFVMTYDMDVRIEPVETLMGDSRGKQQGQAGQYSPMGSWNSHNQQQEQFERAMHNNGRVPANAW